MHPNHGLKDDGSDISSLARTFNARISKALDSSHDSKCCSPYHYHHGPDFDWRDNPKRCRNLPAHSLERRRTQFLSVRGAEYRDELISIGGTIPKGAGIYLHILWREGETHSYLYVGQSTETETRIRHHNDPEYRQGRVRCRAYIFTVDHESDPDIGLSTPDSQDDDERSIQSFHRTSLLGQLQRKDRSYHVRVAGGHMQSRRSDTSTKRHKKNKRLLQRYNADMVV